MGEHQVNNRFVYVKKNGRSVSRGHHNNDWIVLDQAKCYRHFQHLRNQTEHDYDKVKVYYSADHRLDIKLYAIDQTQPNLMLTFEDGCPYEEDDDVPEPILRPGDTLVNLTPLLTSRGLPTRANKYPISIVNTLYSFGSLLFANMSH
jgi:hypothetical protein